MREGGLIGKRLREWVDAVPCAAVQCGMDTGRQLGVVEILERRRAWGTFFSAGELKVGRTKACPGIPYSLLTRQPARMSRSFGDTASNIQARTTCNIHPGISPGILPNFQQWSDITAEHPNRTTQKSRVQRTTCENPKARAFG